MKTIRSVDQLTLAELARIRGTLVDRYGIRQRGNIVEVGFGAAERNAAIDPRRRDAICFYVLRKRDPRRAADRIPATERVRVKRGRHFVMVELPTDVIEIERDAIELTGRRIEHAEGTSHATAGAIVAWRGEGEHYFRYAVLTVGHLFWDRRKTPETSRQVVIRAAGHRRLRGRLVLRSEAGAGVDAALVELSRQDLIAGGLLADQASSRGKRVRRLTELMNDPWRSGVTLPRRQPFPFLVLRYLPEFSLISELGTITHVLEVRSQVAGAFGQGTSGAAWIIARQAACQQFAGWRSNRPGEDYRRGNGQALETILDWCRGRLAAVARQPAQAIELRLIREL